MISNIIWLALSPDFGSGGYLLYIVAKNNDPSKCKLSGSALYKCIIFNSTAQIPNLDLDRDAKRNYYRFSTI
jgi:hypothetical protein